MVVLGMVVLGMVVLGMFVLGRVGVGVVCLVGYLCEDVVETVTGFQGLYKDCVTDCSVVVI